MHELTWCRERARGGTVRGRALLIGVLALVASSPGGAQPGSPVAMAAPGTPLTLRRALELAAERSPVLERVEAQFGMARGENRTIGQWPNPILEYRRENLGAPLDPDEFFTAYIPIDVTGRRVQLARATRRGSERLASALAASRRDAELAIAQSWLTAALSQDLGETAQRQFEAVTEIARLQAERAREGVASEASALRTRVEADRLAHQAALSEARAIRDRQALAAALGVPADSLPPLPSMLTGLDRPELGATAALASLPDAALLERARVGREELRAAEVAREEATLRRAVERGAVLGDWQLQGGSKLTGGFMSGQVGLAVPLPFFNRNAGARERATSAVREAEAAWRSTMLTVTGEVLSAAAQLRRLLALGDRMATTPGDGDIIAESARIAYTEGHMTLLELLDAQRAAADARTTAQQYRADLLLAQLTLARAIGASLLPGATP
jgi:outer membrane protein, heavy metal efflux system